MSTQFTKLEKSVLDAFIPELYAEPGFSDVSPQDLATLTKIPMSSLRGVLGSLAKKSVISIWDKEDLGSDADIVYLNEAFYYLHPEWSK
jgi:hypothetical protein